MSAETANSSARRPVPSWLRKLLEVLRKLDFPVVQIVASDASIDVNLAFAGGHRVTVSIRPKGGGEGFAAKTDSSVIRYRTPADLSAEARKQVDVLVQVLQRLEPKLPPERRGVAWVGEDPAGEPLEVLTRLFPFVSAERSEVEGRLEIQVLVRLVEACNQDCPFCSAPEFREPSAEAVSAMLDFVSDRLPGSNVALTGGEPTLRPSFFEVLRYALDRPGIGSVQVQTNAVGFATEERVRQVPSSDKLNFFVSLHAVDAAVYDRCTGSRGQLPRALQGIRNLLAAGHRLTLNTVVCAPNVAHLRDMVAALPGLLPGASVPMLHYSIVMCFPHRPDGPEFLVRYSELVPALAAAVAEAERQGIPVEPLVSSTHASLPLCLVDQEARQESRHRPVLSESETGYEDFSKSWVKAASCRTCRFARHCLGVPVPYARRFGFGELSPVFEAGVTIVQVDRDRRHAVLRAEGPVPPAQLAARLDEAVAAGADRILLHAPFGVLSSACMAAAAPHRNRLHASVLLPPGDRPDAWDAVAGAALLEAAVAAGVSLEFVYPLTRSRVVDPGPLAAFAWAVGARYENRTFLVLEVPDPGAGGEPPVALSALERNLPGPIRDLLGWKATIRSRAGRPLCLFPDLLASVLAGGVVPADAANAGVYGPGCDRCAFRASCGGVTAGYARALGVDELRPFVVEAEGAEASGGPSWEQKVRWLLTDRPAVRARLKDVLPASEMPRMRCILPWTRVELHDGGTYGPCCADYMEGRTFLQKGASPASLWNGDLLKAFRRALAGDGHPVTCRTSCPVLAGGTDLPEDLQLRGGTAEEVENQIRRIRCLIEGREEVDATPASFCFPVTSWCNYNCLMCHCGEEGIASDERPAAFYKALEPWIRGGVRIDVNGGEPLSSRPFRDFVESLARSGRPPLLGMTTNASFLTPGWLERLPRIPFDSLLVSLNAATPDTYLAVNRGLTWEAIRRNLDALLRHRVEGRFPGGLTYGMVLLKRNLAEVRPFADLAMKDGANVRFLLPNRDRNGQSIMTDPEAMTEALASLEEVAARFEAAGWQRSARDARANAAVLRDRLARSLFEVL